MPGRDRYTNKDMIMKASSATGRRFQRDADRMRRLYWQSLRAGDGELAAECLIRARQRDRQTRMIERAVTRARQRQAEQEIRRAMTL